MSGQSGAERLAAVELQLSRLSARLTNLERRIGAGPVETDADRQARAHRERLTGRPICPTCGGSTMLLDDLDRAYPCPSCHPSTRKTEP